MGQLHRLFQERERTSSPAFWASLSRYPSVNETRSTIKECMFYNSMCLHEYDQLDKTESWKMWNERCHQRLLRTIEYFYHYERALIYHWSRYWSERQSYCSHLAKKEREWLCSYLRPEAYGSKDRCNIEDNIFTVKLSRRKRRKTSGHNAAQ